MKMANNPFQDLSQLLDRGDELAASGDARGAVTFYQSALAVAQALPGVDGVMLNRLHSVHAYVQAHIERFRDKLEDHFRSATSDDPVEQLRLTHARDILDGQREIHAQQPSVLYYPYLAQRQFFEREEFDWVSEIESATPAIRDELLALVRDGADFRPYIEDDPNRPHRDFHGLNQDMSWSALYLWRDGKRVEDVAERCPKTMAALARVPLSHIGARTPAAFFSRLEPGARIPPHTGMLNCRLICHLPLVVPPGCWLRVGNETREWEEGKLLIFDDSIEHEAKNPSGEMRIILIFDIWRPELGEAERTGISAVFDAIDTFQALPDA